jgi:glycopeptide antibiotics resistance protein
VRGSSPLLANFSGQEHHERGPASGQVALARRKRLLVGYFVVLFVLVGWPKVGHPLPDPGARLVLIPFLDVVQIIMRHTWFRMAQVGPDLVGNLLLFIPFGYLTRYTWRRTLLYAFLISLGIEVGQYVLTLLGPWNRRASATDLVLNTAGALLGWWLAKQARARHRPTS